MMGSFSGTAGGLAAGNTSTTGTTPLAHTFNDQQLRHVMIDGEPWFAGADVLTILYGKAMGQAHQYRKLDDAEKRKMNSLHLADRDRAVWAVSESGLYKLIRRSDKATAKPFQNWVTREVLPSIRKTGSYNMADHGREQMPLPAEIAQLLQQMTAMMERMAETQSLQCGPAANPQKSAISN